MQLSLSTSNNPQGPISVGEISMEVGLQVLHWNTDRIKIVFISHLQPASTPLPADSYKFLSAPLWCLL